MAVLPSSGFDFTALTPRERYKILIGTVVPRPIALVTSRDENGTANAAPFSFFNCLSADPAIVALGVEVKADGAPKDTGRNIRRSGVFTVNIVSDAIAEAMNVCAVPFAPGVDELVAAGLTALPGQAINCPRIGEAPAALECRLHSFLEIGSSREIILGEVVFAHIRSDAVDERLHIDPARIDAVGRMGGHGYATTRDYFDLPTMSEARFREEGEGANRRQPRRLNGG
ncbi:flavin reductase family protein [Pseudoroseomonas cervicalis]|uniref:flavin reductase family protein n=1 Tax=Teichococcus cervicalis TaxID=204525 RepID=UPI0027878A51|nr:flavin reductase family protein [Pseudoroseomonas cervicalis]MDQ1081972.1 flavin reductase (DIM6/NTAB) family NADH-FMN oxidoreductase RutF [Pseudoroseomonas cervicalis]